LVKNKESGIFVRYNRNIKIMNHLNVDNIYHEIMLLSEADREKLYNQIKKEFYLNNEIVAYTSDGKSLTRKQYQMQVKAGIEQCMKGESIGIEELAEELGYNYADL